MLAINSLYKAMNTKHMTEFNQSKKAIQAILEKKGGEGRFDDYFLKTGTNLIEWMEHSLEIQSDSYYTENDFDTLLEKNHKLYEDILGEAYKQSYVNPSYSVACFGTELGHILSSVSYLLREYVGLCYEQRFSDMLRLNQLYLNIYEELVVKGSVDSKALSECVRDSMMMNLDELTLNNWFRGLSPEANAYSSIVDHYDLADLRYLFRYGMYIDSNEIESAKYIATLSEDKVQVIADTYTQAYERGFVKKGIDLSQKKSTLVTYHIGWERFVRAAYKNFEALGLKPIVQYKLRAEMRPRLYNTRPNRQMDHDHRFSDAVYFDKTYMEALKAADVKALAQLKKEADDYAGVALFEVFGDKAFLPISYEANMTYSESIRTLTAEYSNFRMAEFRRYVRGDNYSFTINDYPLPSIGEDYQAIFEETIKVNTLDQKLYEDIQAKMIDALDQSEYVHVLGSGDNETDIKVALYALKDPSKETIFENCTADVNVPVGEVFTTPVLEGTNGLLHVKDVYLKGLQYLELKIWFENGMISKYDCKNFETDEENQKYVLESLIHPHATLPIGEFAIGTNTVAYMMAKKYNINSILPILIGEKTGPHFAIGDTCYHWAEDNAVYNPNGKEIVARDNSVSILRKTNISKAYLNKHTDITIPYDELGSIIGYNGDGKVYKIIENGRFVLEGTEILNEPFDN